MIKKIVIFLLLSTSLIACSCANIKLEDRIKSTSDIYIGKLLSFNQAINKEHGYPFIQSKFELVKVLKGKELPLLNLVTGLGGGDCGISMNLNKNYLIFQNENDNRISICDGSTMLNYQNSYIVNKVIKYLED